MPTDQELLKERVTRLARLTSAQAAHELARSYGLSTDSVRGRLSRAGGSYSVDALKALATTPKLVGNSVEVQKAIVTRSKATLELLLARGGQQVALFASDKHLPFARFDALRLEEQIIADLQPDYITVGNDLIDNDGYGRWEDKRSVDAKVWSGDFANRWELEKATYRAMQRWGANLIEVAGNHDNWFPAHLREVTPQTAEAVIARYMQDKEAEGVLQFSNGSTENYVRLNEALVFWHGQFASKNQLSNAKNTLEQFVFNGVASSVVVGHTHRGIRIEGSNVGYSGVTYINSPCLSRIENIPYLKRDPKGWNLGLTVAWFDPHSRHHELDLVVFEAVGNKLTARFNGHRYDTELDLT